MINYSVFIFYTHHVLFCVDLHKDLMCLTYFKMKKKIEIVFENIIELGAKQIALKNCKKEKKMGCTILQHCYFVKNWKSHFIKKIYMKITYVAK